jgi:hypothetical protein
LRTPSRSFPESGIGADASASDVAELEAVIASITFVP